VGGISASQPPNAGDVERLFRVGKYGQVVEMCRRVEPAARPMRLTILLADALAATGDPKGASAALQTAAEDGQGNAAWRRAMARALAHVGRYAEALPHAVAAAELAPRSARAAVIRGGLLEALGRSDEAKDVYGAAVAALSDTPITDAAELVAMGQALDRHAVLTGQQASKQVNNILNNYFQRVTQEIDETYWPAHLAAGLFAASKHRPNMARRELTAALEINPAEAEALAGLAELALRDWDFESAMSLADKALAANPTCVEARVARARCYLQWRRPSAALIAAREALSVNPNHEEALSLIAAVCARQGRQDDLQAYRRRVEAVNPSSWLLPFTIGEWLAAARQFDVAEGHYLEAIERVPAGAEPLAGLGLLYMQQGREDEARDVLGRAHAIDDFRADVVNYVNLLDAMRSFDVVETEHFIVAVDGEHDGALLGYVAEEAERIYPEICGDFVHEPAGKTKIQIFPTHEQFSIRITGRGWIGTVGACTGPVIALAAPNAERSDFGAFNWAVVLRHELTHTVTLSATGNRIPQWLTEACAVWEQPDRRNHESVRALVEAVRHGRLLPIDELDWGFVRPTRRGDRTLAYAQAELIMEYVIETKGFETALAMLADFRDGRSQAEVFRRHFGANEAGFDKAFAAWARKTIEGWGYNVSPRPAPAEAAKNAADHPDDPAAQAALSQALQERGQLHQAREAAEKAVALQDDHLLARTVLAEIAMAEDDVLSAMAHAEAATEAHGDTPRLLRLKAQVFLATHQYDLALQALQALQGRRPLDLYSYRMLADLYAQLGLTEQALANWSELHRRTMTSPVYARQIADVYRAQGDDEQALHYFRQVIHVDPYDPAVHEAIAAIHRNAGRGDQAVQAARCLTQLSPGSAEAWAKLAMVRFVAAREAADADAMRQARDEAAKAVALEPDGPGKAVLRRIDDALSRLPDGS